MRESKLKTALIQHQIERLKETYADFLNDEFSQELGTFFFDRLYSTQGKSKRDEDFKKLYEYFKDKLGQDFVAQLGKLVNLNDLTDRLDDLVVEQIEQLGLGTDFTREQYELAYRLCDNYEDRKQQIELICDTLLYFHKVSFWRSMSLVLRVVRMVARMKGAPELGDFLYDGYQTFRTVKDIEPFRAAMLEREMERLDRIWRDYPLRLNGTKRRKVKEGGTTKARK